MAWSCGKPFQRTGKDEATAERARAAANWESGSALLRFDRLAPRPLEVTQHHKTHHARTHAGAGVDKLRARRRRRRRRLDLGLEVEAPQDCTRETTASTLAKRE